MSMTPSPTQSSASPVSQTPSPSTPAPSDSAEQDEMQICIGMGDQVRNLKQYVNTLKANDTTRDNAEAVVNQIQQVHQTMLNYIAGMTRPDWKEKMVQAAGSVGDAQFVLEGVQHFWGQDSYTHECNDAIASALTHLEDAQQTL